MGREDLLDELQREWRRERPDLATDGMAVVGRLILLGEALKKRAHRVLAPFGLGYTDLDVLATLRRSGEPCVLRPADLLQKVLIQSGSLTACLDRLERQGWVERVPNPQDRRGRSVALTKSGRELVDRAIAARFASAEELMASVAASDRDRLADLLRDLLAIVNSVQEESP
ncbi:MAG: MarR family transcriptional regulator [Acidobacteriota bacterium]